MNRSYNIYWYHKPSTDEVIIGLRGISEYRVDRYYFDTECARLGLNRSGIKYDEMKESILEIARDYFLTPKR